MGFIYFYNLNGEIVAKKNSKQIFINKKTNKPFISSSKNFTEWHRKALIELLEQEIPEKPIDKPVLIRLDFVHGDHRRRDSDNGTSSIFDLLVDGGVLADDSYSIVKAFSVTNEYDKNKARCKITIQEL